MRCRHISDLEGLTFVFRIWMFQDDRLGSVRLPNVPNVLGDGWRARDTEDHSAVENENARNTGYTSYKGGI